MAIPSLASLLIQETKDIIYSGALAIATTLGLPVTSWQAGDPTRSLFFVESSLLERLEATIVGFIQSGFLDYATGQWLVQLAKQVYNVDVPPPTFAETDVVLTNALGGIYDIAVGDLVFKSSTTNKTYHNTSGGILNGSGGTLTVSVEADEAGAASTAAPGEIDTLVTTLLGVTCTNPAAAVGVDQLDDASIRQLCRNKLGSLSPNGPASAYSFVATNSALTGVQTITRVRVYPDSDTGDVLVYVAGPGGPVGGGDVAAALAAILRWATPLTITPTVLSATGVTINITYTLWVYKSVNQTTGQIATSIQDALISLFQERPIGGDIIPPATTGALYVSLLESAIRGVFPDKAFRVLVTAPGGDTALSNGQVPVLGVITPTINLIDDPK